MAKKKKAGMATQLNKIFLVAIIAGLAALIGMFIFSSFKKELPVLGDPGHTVGNFSFTDQDGKTFTDKGVDGKIRVAEYFFTTCKGICPVMNDNMQSVQKAFANRDDVIIMSHTVDPGVDNPHVLKVYATRMHALPGKWEFLTGDKNALYKMAQQDYLLSADTTANIDSSFLHAQYVTLVDKQNRIRGFYDATDKEAVQRLISDIKSL